MKTVPLSVSVLETLESRLAPAGLVTLNLTAAGALTVAGDTLDNDFVITESGDQWTISAVAGSTTMFRLNGGAEQTAITFDAPLSLTAKLGAGNDDMTLNGTLIPKNLNVDTGDGNDVLDLTSASIGGTAVITMGKGNDYFTAGGELTFAKGLSVNLGAGANTFDVNADSFSSGGNVSATASGLASELQAFVLKTGDGYINGSLTLKTTTASPTDFEIGDSAIDVLEVTKAMTLQSAAGEDVVTLKGDLHVGGLLSMRLGNGNNSVVTTDLDQLSSYGLTYTGGTGNDTFELEAREVIVAGNFSFSAGAGTNRLDLNPSEYLGITKALTYTGGAGVDDFFLDGPAETLENDEIVTGVVVSGLVTMNASNGDNYLGINAISAHLGGVKYTGGTGIDIVDIGQFEGNSDLINVYGAVTINTGTNEAEVMIWNADLRGNLAVTTNVFAGGADTIQLLNSDFRGTTSLTMKGNADSDVKVDDSIFDRNVTIGTGNGSDYVLFDTDAAFNGIYSSFYGYVRIFLGNGDDVFLAGGNPVVENVGNDFNNFIDVDGGAGFDSAYFMNSEFYNNAFNPHDDRLDPGDLPWTIRVEDYA